MDGCGKEIDYTIPKGYGYKTLKYKCGSTGIDGYPVLCDTCSSRFDRAEYRRQVAEAGERIDDDY